MAAKLVKMYAASGVVILGGYYVYKFFQTRKLFYYDSLLTCPEFNIFFVNSGLFETNILYKID